MGVAPYTSPEPLAEHHSTDAFASGEPSLDAWLQRRALANQASGATRTFVACHDRIVIAYYALASGAVTIGSVPGKFRRNMPDPVPVVVLARLAVDLTHQGRGIGRALFRDAGQRVAHAAEAIGIRGIVVHAISAAARDFYLQLGFEPCPLDPMTLAVTLKDLQSAMK